MNAQTPPQLPNLPPNIFASLQVIERAISESSMTRQRHLEAEQALNNVAQFCVEANKRQSAEPVEAVPASN